MEYRDANGRAIRVGDRVRDRYERHMVGTVVALLTEEQQNPAWHVGPIVVVWDLGGACDTNYAYALEVLDAGAGGGDHEG